MSELSKKRAKAGLKVNCAKVDSIYSSEESKDTDITVNPDSSISNPKPQITQVTSSSAPPKGKLHWDSGSKQWFKKTNIDHKDIPKPIEVRIFKYNTDEPKIRRWLSHPDNREQESTVVSYPYKVEQVDSCSDTSSLDNQDFRIVGQSQSKNLHEKNSAINTSIAEGSHTNPAGGNHDNNVGYSNVTTRYESSNYAASQPINSQVFLTGNGRTPESFTMSSNLYSKDSSPGRTTLGTIYAPDSFSKTQAKAELQAISSRLGNYIQYVREISENANQVDLEAFVNSIKILEQELVNMKGLYEQELGSARQEGGELSRTKNQLAQENNKLKANIAELENRLGNEVDKNRQAINEINTLQHTLMQREQDVTQAKLAIQKPVNDLDQLTNEFHAVLREKEECKRRYEQEQLARQELADKNHQLQKKIDIDTQVSQQEIQDLSDRLNAASNTVLKLEAKIREMTHADTALAEMLARVREVAEGEIRRYQEESEARFSQNVSELQSQINESNRKIADLNERNQQLHTEIGDYQSENRSLQGQVTSLTHQRRVLEEELATDRQRSHEHIKLLENKLVQLQDNIITKMKELNAARDAQIPLKAEIETLRSMLEEEERRLRLPASPRMDVSLSGASKSHVTAGNMATNFSSSATAYDPPERSRYSHQESQYTSNVTGGPGPLFTPVCPEGSPRPLGPVRVRSAPVSKQRFVPTSLGQGQDYFDEMFHDLHIRDKASPIPGGSGAGSQGPATAAATKADRRGSDDSQGSTGVKKTTAKSSYDYATYNSSAVGDLKILEVCQDGSYVRLLNSAITKEADLGGFMIQQNVGGHPVAVFRFPPRVRISAGEAVTVWANCSDPANHKPPTDYFYKEQEKWGTGPECTTILCKANGQAVAWTTASQRFTQDVYHDSASQISAKNEGENGTQEQTTDAGNQSGELPVYDMNLNATPKEPVYLRREKESPPCLIAQNHPHGESPPSPVHPHTGQARPLTYGNDNSTRSRQSRSQTTRPDPIPGAPYAGASAQRMGSASLRRYPANPTTIRGSGALANKSSNPPGTVTSRPPSSFQTPHNRFATGLEQINSQCNKDFQPAMPRPPLFSAW